MDSRSLFAEARFALKPPLHDPLAALDGQTENLVLLLCGFLRKSKTMEGPVHHAWIRDLLQSGAHSEQDVRCWIESRTGAKLSDRKWDFCLKQAERWRAENIRVFRWNYPADSSNKARTEDDSVGGGKESSTHSAEDPACPSVLFARGDLGLDIPRLAFFNSRKPRSLCPDAKWLQALRCVLTDPGLHGVVFATGIGTLTYDMIGAYAFGKDLPFAVATPFSALEPDPEMSRLYGEPARGFSVLSCLVDTNGCSGKRRLLCRDRLLAALSQIHVLLEIRSGGNLATVLERQQRREPRLQFIFDPGKRSSANAGNYLLLEKFSGCSTGFRIPAAGMDAPAIIDGGGEPEFRGRGSRSLQGGIDWRQYLFHYTRECAGPWPGESRRDYLLKLLAGDVLSGHSALDTLMRIAGEGKIRAGTKLVRGSDAVISWSSHPPGELFILRKWNRTLARWTVEPYGIAVRRDVLRSLGAKPAIYGGEQVYTRLAESERYRYQLSRSAPSSSWRHEREWRLRGDLALGTLKRDEGFVFVQTEEEKTKFCNYVESGLSIVVLKALEEVDITRIED